MRLAPLACFAFAFAFAACASDRAAAPAFERDARYTGASGPARDPARALDALHKYRDYTAQQIGRADAVFVGEIMAVGVAKPGDGADAMRTQPVIYQVREVLRGWAPRREIVVHHVVLGPPPTSNADAQALDPALYRVGALLVVPVVLEDARDAAFGDLRYSDPGIAGLPAPATKEIVAEIARMKP